MLDGFVGTRASSSILAKKVVVLIGLYQRYVFRSVMLRFFLTAMIFFVVTYFGELVDLSRRTQNMAMSPEFLFFLALLKTPKTWILMIPFAILISGAWSIAQLARNQELVAVFAGGGSAWTIIKPICLGGLTAGFLIVFLFAPVGSFLHKQFDHITTQFFGQEQLVASLQEQGIWFRTSLPQQQVLIARGSRVDPKSETISDVSMFTLSDDGKLISQETAEQLSFQNGKWIAIGDSFSKPTPIDITLDFTTILQKFEQASWLPIWQLPSRIKDLQIAGFSAADHILQLNRELASILLAMGMAMIGASLPIGHRRGDSLIKSFIVTIAIGFLFFIINDISLALGVTGQLPYWLAAWSPAVISLAMAVIFLRNTREC